MEMVMIFNIYPIMMFKNKAYQNANENTFKKNNNSSLKVILILHFYYV